MDVTNACTQTRACVFREIVCVSVRALVCMYMYMCLCVCVQAYIGKYNNSTMKITNVHTCINVVRYLLHISGGKFYSSV